MFLSFIVPVYKTEIYLERCIKTLLNQDVDDYEILLIDDGSPDNSGCKCDELAAKSDKIRVLHKENEGLGYTRNYGIHHAVGDYLIFIDSDDYFKENALGSLKEIVERESNDIVVYKYERVANGCAVKENTEIFPTQERKKEFDNRTLAAMCIGEPLKKDEFEVGPAWKEMWRREFLLENKLEFPSEREVLSEDYPLATRAFYTADKVSYLNDVLYFYCYNGESLTNTYNPARPLRAVEFYRCMDEIINELGLGENAVLRNQNNFIVNMIQSFKHIVLSDEKYGWKIERISEICNRKEIRAILKYITKFDAAQMKILRTLIMNRLYMGVYMIVYLRYRWKK